jgi:hypothetical protein
MTHVSDTSVVDAADLVELLGDPHRYFRAYQRLLRLGDQAARAARSGLDHQSAQVRQHCCKILDHLMDAADVPRLVAVLDDPAPEVRVAALHALACDRCKNGACRPDTAVLPKAADLLASDPEPLVRAMAAELVGIWAHTDPTAVVALVSAAASDVSPAVRKKAAWYAPGGPIYRRTQPPSARTTRERGEDG